jgi:hypothetical protein
MSDNYVYAYIHGRFGNQFFQYWAAKFIADSLNRKLILYIAESFLINRSIYPFIGDFEKIDNPIDLKNNTYNQAKGYYICPTPYSGNTQYINKIINYHKNKNVPLHFVNFYNEDYSNIRLHTKWINNIYKRSDDFKLICNNSLVVHLRLGDVAYQNININDKYIAFTLEIAKKYKLPVIIVSEEINHICTIDMKKQLDNNKIQCVIANNSIEEYQKDFDIISSAKVIIATNSTFTWWAAFMNPFKPDIFIALSEKQPCSFRNNFLFKRESPSGWNLWDMDKDDWII